MRNALTLAACSLALAQFVIRADHFARSASQTFDEGAHLVAGVSYWSTGSFRINPEHPPLLKLLWAIPIAARSDVSFQPDPDAWDRKDHWTLADQFLYAGPVDHFELLLAARRVNIALGTAFAALIGWWAFRLWGRGAGLTACALAALDPNLVAFAALLSMDAGLALFATAAAYALWEYASTGSRRWFLAAGLFLGLALAAKFSAIVSIAGLTIGVIGYVLAGGTMAIPGAPIAGSRYERLLALPAALVRLGLIAIAVVVLSYAGIHALDWARGLKHQFTREVHGDPHFFLNGEISSTGWWSYFLWVLAIKTPPGTLLLALASLLAIKVGGRFTSREVAFLIVPAGIYFLAMTISRIDIGWRVILPAYPALILVAARAATLVPTARFSRIIGGAIVAVVALSGVTDLRHAGQELSYANGLIAGRADLHEHLGDSNIDWGQGLKALKAELNPRGDPVIYLSYAGTARPEAYGIRHQRLPGWGQFHRPPPDRVDPERPALAAISVSNLQGTYLRDPAIYHWLLSRPPVSRTDGSIWIWDVTGDADALARLQNLSTPAE
jgi:Dolichyl-phosphate-mannose-protein mannosyltransferase